MKNRSTWTGLLRLAISAGAGTVLYASFPPRSLWFLAPVAFAMIVLVLRTGTPTVDRPPSGLPAGKKAAFLHGYLFGLGFFLPLLPWIGVYVGPVPWIALAAAESVFVGLFGLLAVLVARLRGAPVWIATVWTLTEWLRSSVPFGGFPWGRLAFGQSESPLLPIAGLGGAPLLSFAVALTGSGLAALVLAFRGSGSEQRMRVVAGAAVLVVVSPLVAVLAAQSLPGPEDGDRTITVAAIQGSVPQLGLDFNSQRRKVLDNHVQETVRLAEAVDAGTAPKPDVVVWPENASDIDPLRNEDASTEISAASERIGAPILVGAVLVNGDGTTTNSVLVWNGDEGPADRHDKKIIQPFGEYLPFRSFFRLFSSYADSAGHFVPGDGDGVVTVNDTGDLSGPADLAVGVATCYEVAFDRALGGAVRDGAQIIAVPTNNATFGDTEMTYQQLAMSRVRAVEHSRTVIVAATSGVSAVIRPDGKLAQSSELFAPQWLVETVSIRSNETLATRLGSKPEYVLSILALLAVGFSLVNRRRHSAIR